jgi:hypothetical protein
LCATLPHIRWDSGLCATLPDDISRNQFLRDSTAAEDFGTAGAIKAIILL